MLTITLTESGFKTQSANGVWDCVFWDEVREIVAFKRDMLSVDLICLGFRTDDSDNWFEVDEECPGYGPLISEVERRFELTHDWWPKVAFPAFETNFTTLWGEPLLSQSAEDDEPSTPFAKLKSFFRKSEPNAD